MLLESQFKNTRSISDFWIDLGQESLEQLQVALLARLDRMVNIRRGYGSLEHASGAELDGRNALSSSRDQVLHAVTATSMNQVSCYHHPKATEQDRAKYENTRYGALRSTTSGVLQVRYAATVHVKN